MENNHAHALSRRAIDKVRRLGKEPLRLRWSMPHTRHRAHVQPNGGDQKIHDFLNCRGQCQTMQCTVLK